MHYLLEVAEGSILNFKNSCPSVLLSASINIIGQFSFLFGSRINNSCDAAVLPLLSRSERMACMSVSLIAPLANKKPHTSIDDNLSMRSPFRMLIRNPKYSWENDSPLSGYWPSMAFVNLL